MILSFYLSSFHLFSSALNFIGTHIASYAMVIILLDGPPCLPYRMHNRISRLIVFISLALSVMFFISMCRVFNVSHLSSVFSYNIRWAHLLVLLVQTFPHQNTNQIPFNTIFVWPAKLIYQQIDADSVVYFIFIF